MIILEGPDCSGKSTLLELFPAHWAKHHFRHQPDKLKVYKKFLSYCDSRTVIDRFHLSEQVYGPILRNENEFVTTGRFIERELLTTSSQLVLCLPPWRAVEERWRERLKDELVQDPGQMRAIWEAYHEIRTDLPVVMYDYTKDNPEALVNTLVEQQEAELKLGLPFVHGSRDQTAILLVGDQVSSPDQFLVPFTRADAGCSIWLTNLLEQAGVGEDALAWVNMTPTLEPEQFDQLRQFYDASLVIALGHTASAKLSDHGIPHDRFPHPQYWHRFRSSEPYPLIPYLQAATRLI